MSQRYFANILAPNKQMLGKLQAYALDLFHSTAQALVGLAAAEGADAHDEYRIDGLLTLAEIGRLVDDGYQVTVQSTGDRPTAAQTQTIGFEQWLKELEE